MEDFKMKTAEALSPLLSAFHAIAEQKLNAVRGTYVEGSLERLSFHFDRNCLIVTADENDDSLDVIAVAPTDPRCGGADASGLDPWRDLIGRAFGWGWVTVNQQGYCDGLLLSFHDIVPMIILNVMASSIEMGKITMVDQAPVERPPGSIVQ